MPNNPNVLLIDIDSKIPNLALKKLEKYYSQQGSTVYWNMPLMAEWSDVIYVSCIFTLNRDKCIEWEAYSNSWIGGSGYDLDITLCDEIEKVNPKINLGFTTRGCNRKCGFCIVPQKEGKIRAVGRLADLWDGESQDVTILDNNILALPEHFKSVCHEAQLWGIRLDFNQGLDHRLLTDEIASELKRTRHKNEYRFAFDHPDSIDSVKVAIKLLGKHGINRAFWYVLVGYDTDVEADLFRLNYLRAERQTVFVQRYKKDKATIRLAQWANQHHIFPKMTYQEFLAAKDGGA